MISLLGLWVIVGHCLVLTSVVLFVWKDATTLDAIKLSILFMLFHWIVVLICILIFQKSVFLVWQPPVVWLINIHSEHVDAVILLISIFKKQAVIYVCCGISLCTCSHMCLVCCTCYLSEVLSHLSYFVFCSCALNETQ